MKPCTIAAAMLRGLCAALHHILPPYSYEVSWMARALCSHANCVHVAVRKITMIATAARSGTLVSFNAANAHIQLWWPSSPSFHQSVGLRRRRRRRRRWSAKNKKRSSLTLKYVFCWQLSADCLLKPWSYLTNLAESMPACRLHVVLRLLTYCQAAAPLGVFNYRVWL